MAFGKVKAIGMAAGLAARLAFAQAPLPTAWTGPWELGTPPAGWTFSGLGMDYNPDYDGMDDGAAKLQNTSNSITIHFTPPAGSLTYWIRGLTFSGGVFRVEQSVDGTNWSALATYTNFPTNATFQTHFPSATAEYLRFFYELKGTGNVGVDGISIYPFLQPVLAAIDATGPTAVTVEETVPGRTYALDYTVALATEPSVEWTQVDVQTGTGAALVLEDAAPTNTLRFYRVRDATP